MRLVVGYATVPLGCDPTSLEKIYVTTDPARIPGQHTVKSNTSNFECVSVTASSRADLKETDGLYEVIPSEMEVDILPYGFATTALEPDLTVSDFVDALDSASEGTYNARLRKAVEAALLLQQAMGLPIQGEDYKNSPCIVDSERRVSYVN